MADEHPCAGPALLVVAAALIDRRDHVLLQQRPAGKHHGGLWEFPGGKVEPGEGPLAALARELREELGIDVAPGDCTPLGFAASEDGRAVVLLLYACRVWAGDAASREGGAVVWCAPDRLLDRPMPPLDIPLAQMVARMSRAIPK
ncbi:(deoxy)nucleoside triphosphate pyrophosphohydrolase [Novosphingobium sp.]|uniref:(deoxy)nucleoside triphosphate pyrophosphohydrolase n=1 Tax=Novosphingobium sp. TaxID=1874826 RepID=UPI003B52CE47